MNTAPVSASGGAGGAKPVAAAGRGRLLPLIAPVVAAGAAASVAAAVSFAAARPSAGAIAGVVLLLAAACLAEAFPVPMESLPAGNVSLAAVFVVGAAVVFGWEAATLIALLTRTALELHQRRPLVKLAYNSAMYALGGAAAGAAASLDTSAGVYHLIGAVILGAAGFYLVNLLLLALIVARVSGEPLVALAARTAYWTAIPFAIMASASLMLTVLWERSPVLVVALVGPLLAIVLYQRSVYRSLAAMRLALTDALTGVGNARHFHERLQVDLDRAADDGRPLSVCLIDLDDFKRINDSYGHAAGDRVLAAVAESLRHGGEAFRVGGDEFALLLPGRGVGESRMIANAVLERLSKIESAPGELVAASVGVATYPNDTPDRSELLRLADEALYRAKNAGKNRTRHAADAAVEAPAA